MRLVHASEIIMEIYEVTGFSFGHTADRVTAARAARRGKGRAEGTYWKRSC